jgi:hypothetical protein
MFIAGKALGIALLLSSITAAAQTGGKPASSLAAQETKASQAEQKDGSALSDQDSSGWLAPGADPENRLGAPFLRHLAADQQQFWTSPERLDRSSWKTLVPFVGLTGALLASDSWIAKQVPDKPDQLKRSKNVSEIAAFSLIGAGGGAFLWGHLTHNERLQETGLLSGEAAINSAAVTYAFKGTTQRPRPFEGNGNGSFFQGGGSFPSEHSALAWSIASVVAHEYPGPLTKLLAYSLASTVTLTRVTSKQHFASDALVGSALGWYFGRQIYRARHDPTVGGGAWGDFLESSSEGRRNPANMGSPYVPVDSWVYPIFDRLAALGYVQTAYAGLRPWTRMECARLLEEVGERVRYGDEPGGGAEKLYGALMTEFSDETRRLDGGANLGAAVDSIYTRMTGISGTPLRDGYHFGQTVVNDYGRPYREGFNAVSGVTAHAVAGPLSFSFQGEYQHAPAIASDPVSVLQATAHADGTLPLPNGVPNIDQFRLLNSTVAVTFKNIQVSFGKQSLELGPGDGGSFLFSNNAEPVPMLRIDQVSPVRIPGLSRLLGPARTEFFLGQLSGHHWIYSDGTLFGPSLDRQPFIHGTKVSFKPTPNFEFGMGFTVLFGGPDLPFTWHNFLRTFYANAIPGTAADPGDRRSTFDFSYRVPHLRDWLTIYADSFVEDEYSPLGSTRPSMRMGMYLPRVPKVPKLDLRLEGVYTDVPGQRPTGFLYFNARYRSGYTNNGNLLASWIGREGRGGQAWATYWLSPRSKFQLAYRHAEVDKEFIGGGRLNDFAGHADFMLRPGLAISGLLQYEQWKFPVLSPTGQSNFSASVQLTLYPNWRIRK